VIYLENVETQLDVFKSQANDLGRNKCASKRHDSKFCYNRLLLICQRLHTKSRKLCNCARFSVLHVRCVDDDNDYTPG